MRKFCLKFNLIVVGDKLSFVPGQFLLVRLEVSELTRPDRQQPPNLSQFRTQTAQHRVLI
jgi:hypothetical protein